MARVPKLRSRGKLLAFPVPKHGTVSKRHEAGLNEFVRAHAGRHQKKSVRDFVAEHRDDLRKYVLGRVPNLRGIDDDELRRWILNDEHLYRWALEEGVEV